MIKRTSNFSGEYFLNNDKSISEKGEIESKGKNKIFNKYNDLDVKYKEFQNELAQASKKSITN